MNTNELNAKLPVVKVYSDSETGMMAVVMRGENGFHVQLKDVDEDEWVPVVKIFPYDKFEVGSAIDYARTILYGPTQHEDSPSLNEPWYANK